MTWSIKSTSKWNFKTSGTGGIGVSFLVGSRGEILLTSPEGIDKTFHYTGAGVGVSFGFKRLPKIGRFDAHGVSEKGGGVIAPESFPNHGLVYVLTGCSSAELSEDDFKGVCVFYDAGIGLVAGYAAEVMLMGCNPVAFAAAVSGPMGVILADKLLNPHAMLVSWGPNVGLQANAGISGSIGYMT